MNTVWILTEADEAIASGHLMECIDLAQAGQSEGWMVTLFVNEDCPRAFKDRIPFAYQTYRRQATGTISVPNNINTPDVFVFNFRAITNCVLDAFRGSGAKLICIDEFGHRPIACDVIINPMVDPYYWRYETDATIYGGAQYLALSKKLQAYRKREKVIRDHIEHILVTMGGVDLHGTTVKLARWLPDICEALPQGEQVHIDLVLGGGFPYNADLKKVLAEDESSAFFQIHQNIDYLYDLMLDADIAFCAGGNTLHELATLGTPAIVIPTMPHEWRNGKAFEQKGCCVGLALATEVMENDVRSAVQVCEPMAVRQRMSECGRAQFDGMGRKRMLEIIKDVME